MIQTHLFQKFKSTYVDSFVHFSQHLLEMATFLSICVKFRHTLWTVPILTLLNIKTFTIFHDCGHQSYSPSPLLNYAIGTVAGIWTLTPVSWSYDHYLHHLTNGKIDNPHNFSFNTTVVYTKQEIEKFTKLEKIAYFVFRHPIVYHLILPPLKFFFMNRFDYLVYKILNKYPYEKSIVVFIFNALIHNVGVVGLVKFLYKMGIFHHYLLSMYLASVIGTVLFHNQHTFNPAYVVDSKQWSLKDSGLIGSSCIVLPKWIQYFTNGIEYHHIHHMNPRIPGYHLQQYHEYLIEHDATQVEDVNYLTLWDCIKNCGLTLYDEVEKKYVHFRTF